MAQPQGARERGSDLDSVAAESGGCCVGMVLGEEIELRWELRLGGGPGLAPGKRQTPVGGEGPVREGVRGRGKVRHGHRSPAPWRQQPVRPNWPAPCAFRCLMKLSEVRGACGCSA